MIADIVQRPLLGLFVLALIFNMTQRWHLSHGEKKRFASLAIAGMILVLYLGVALVSRFGATDLLLLVPVVVVAGIAMRLRKVLGRFRLSCVSCGRPLPLVKILYYDDNRCQECAARDEQLSEYAGNAEHHAGGTGPRDVEEIAWNLWVPEQDAVLCFVRDGESILLIQKKKGLGAGKINAPGGRIEHRETAKDAAVRETQEEVGLTPLNLTKRADLSFQFTDGFSLHGSAFIAESYSGELIETEEAAPFWCEISRIPYDRMWEDDAVWLPLVLDGNDVVGRFVFDGDKMCSKSVEVLERGSLENPASQSDA